MFVTEDPKDLKLYGLDEPQQEVSLITKGTEGARIVQFGSPLTNDTTKVYAKRKVANSIFTVKSDILTNLVFQVNDLRDRKLADFENDQIHALDLQLGAQTARLTHHTNQWTIVEPPGLKPEESACTDMLDHIRDAQVKEFIADVVTDPAQFGLDKPVVQITLKKEKVVTTASKTNEPPKAVASTNTPPATESVATTNIVPLVTIQVGKTDPAKGLVYVKRADEAFVYGLDTNFVAQLPRSVLDLRERTILSLDSSAIRKLDIARGGVTFAVEQVTKKDTNGVEKSEWKLVTPAQGVLA